MLMNSKLEPSTEDLCVAKKSPFDVILFITLICQEKTSEWPLLLATLTVFYPHPREEEIGFHLSAVKE